MIAWKIKVSVFVGNKVTLIPTPDPTGGEVKREVLDGIFLELFPLITYQLNLNIKSLSNHQK